jgi:molecular chaperone GrpE
MSNEFLENTPETFKKLIDEVNDYKDKFLRVSAEATNFKRRVEKEKESAVKFANEKLAKDLILTLDNFESSLKVEMPHGIRMGIELIYKDLLNTLKKYNITECQVDKFDPQMHEAVSVVSVGMTSNAIVDVLRKGYFLEDRLLRPASVILSR